MKNKTTNFIIVLFLGILGIHKFIEGNTKLGIIYLFTGGLFGIGWIIDIIKALAELINDNASAKSRENKVVKEEIVIDRENNISTINNKIRKSTRKFAFFDDESRYLQYAYYDVEVKGIEYRDFDISKIEIEHQLYFDTEPENQYDPNAIKILYDNIFIGYIPKNNLQKMMLDYSDGVEHQVCGMIYSVNEETKTIQIGLAFYSKINERVEYLDTKLVKTTKRDNIEDRQDNLSFASVDEEVELEYDYETETYIVTTSGLEIGEINKSNSQKLQDYEADGLEFKAGILDIDENESGNLECKIRIIIK